MTSNGWILVGSSVMLLSWLLAIRDVRRHLRFGAAAVSRVLPDNIWIGVTYGTAFLLPWAALIILAEALMSRIEPIVVGAWTFSFLLFNYLLLRFIQSRRIFKSDFKGLRRK
jgi:hypothetical protein